MSKTKVQFPVLIKFLKQERYSFPYYLRDFCLFHILNSKSSKILESIFKKDKSSIAKKTSEVISSHQLLSFRRKEKKEWVRTHLG